MKAKIIQYLTLFVAALFHAQTNSENYIQSTTCLDSTCIRKVETIQYFDFLGRPKQVIGIKATPSGKDLVTPIVYDELGRQTRDYLPVPQSATTNGQIYPQSSGLNPYPVADAGNFYANEKIFTEKVLENSPLERLLQQKSVGAAWSDKPVVFGYDINAAADHVKKYEVSTTWDTAQKLYINQFQTSSEYRAGILIKNTVTDEDGNTSIEFKDGTGQTVLVRKVVSGSQNADTYYVYNDYKQLAYVIPPLASGLAAISASTLADLCYQYRYDSKNRLAEKKLPGKGWEYMVYDKQDRLVLTQDANLRSPANNFLKRGWVFTKYDAFGRVVYTGFFANTADRATMQNSLNNMAANAGNNESRDNTNPIIQNGENIFYTQNAFPTGSMTILTVNYYDTYPALPSGVVIPTEIMGQKVLKQFGHSTSGKNTKDLPLASYVKNIEDDSWTKSFVYFDVKGRSIGGLALNHLGGYTKTESELDFAGITRKSKTYHKRLAADTEKIITQTFEYDSQNRLMKHWHQVNSQPQELLTENRYNELSQLTNKKVGNNLQSIDYAYNIRGWMTKINDPAALNGKLFGYEMKYQNAAAGKYNGNISQVDWRTAQDEVLKRYSYQYDPLNRLKKATYSEPNASIPGNDFFNESIDYDMNGNITSLQRNSKGVNGIKEQIDDLTYQYNGNRLNTVTDASTNYRGYPDVSGTPVVYDDNGNMKEHKDKGILEIRYNFLDLPTAMKFDQLYFTRGVWQNVNTAFTYRADGTKLKKVYKYSEDSVYKQKVTEYLDGFQYEIVSTNADPLIKFVPTAEGYYNFENNKYIYSYVDHLGNVRVSYFNNGNSAEVLEENNYYPFGLKHEGYNALAGNPAYKYQYNGKELQQETGWNDYGARFYMPDVGRWGVVDPLAEMYRRYSPYNYTVNNPINFTDPDGRWVRGAGFWNNLTKSDARIHAEQWADQLGSGNYNVSVNKGNNGTWNVTSHTLNLSIKDTFNSKGLVNTLYTGSAEGGGLGTASSPGNPWGASFSSIPDSRGKTDIQTMVAEHPMVQEAALMAATSGIGNAIRGALRSTALTATEAVETVETASLSSLNPTHAITKSKTQMQTLLNDVAANGVKDPIKYVEFNGQKYIVDGHHRFFSAQRAGIQNVPVQQVKLPYAGYQTTQHLMMEGSSPGYWRYMKVK
ncbi:DUF6443 domain-containing protein [Chryseobacterium fluminis]|uniref:DUF6443 domain-containing protein n=1 Tax=Chryseobacterium fluminis TaxID=2983606 RepID=UPI00225BBAAE|nr:DUF6443 domain-containing protein [Chryseobacterium sp. MMS21-Ot14]UZT99848.1 DUF6443 domain-containing protein [Chryseobacterium sp. MMS21-Ot14]